MSSVTNDTMIIPTITDTAPKIGAKTKKSKKKNKVSSSRPKSLTTTESAAVPDVSSVSPSVDSVINDLQDRLKLSEAEDSGFGEANGHDEPSTAEPEVECAQPASVVRSGPDDLIETVADATESTSRDPTTDCHVKVTNEPTDEATNSTTKLNESSISYVSYQNELQMPDIMRLIQKDLSEPYSIYTYRYFIHNWPKLCFLAMHDETCVGAIVCKLDIHRQNTKRGYIAMLAVDKEYRKLKIGTNLVQNAIHAMLAYHADEVVLETEITNIPALRLYENLGFVRDKRLFGYYLNGVDALRLKLWFR